MLTLRSAAGEPPWRSNKVQIATMTGAPKCVKAGVNHIVPLYLQPPLTQRRGTLRPCRVPATQYLAFLHWLVSGRYQDPVRGWVLFHQQCTPQAIAKPSGIITRAVA